MAKQLKIGIVADTSLDPEDGVQQYMMSVGEWLREQGHDVHYIVGETKTRDLPNIHSLCKNITVRFNGNLVSIPLWVGKRKVRRFLETEKFDVLHIQTPHHPLMAQRVILAASPETAIVSTFHILPYNWLAAFGNKLLGFTLRPSLKRIDQMMAVSSSAKQFEMDTFGQPAIVSPNVFNYDRFTSAKPLKRYQDGRLTILFLGRLVERKGCQYLLEAISRIDPSTVPEFRVVICGRGELLGQLQEYTTTAGMSDIVEFTGFVSDEDKPGYYASADIAVFPSTGGESFGIVLVEAMASGKTAVLGGDNPGYSAVMEPRLELLFSPQNVDALADRLSGLLKDTEQRQEIAAWGKQYTKRFDIEVVGPELVELYERLHDKRKRTIIAS